MAILAYLGSSGLDVYGWMGSLATYGFIVAYALVCIALPRYLRDHGVFRQGAQIIPWLAFIAMLAAMAGNLYPVPEGPYGKLPYIYLAYLGAGMILFFWQSRKEKPGTREASIYSGAHDCPAVMLHGWPEFPAPEQIREKCQIQITDAARLKVCSFLPARNGVSSFELLREYFSRQGGSVRD